MQREYGDGRPGASAAATIRRHPSGGSARRVYAGCVAGHWELIVLAVVLVLLFGAKQLPQIGRQLGRGVRELKDTVGDVDPREDVRRAMEAPEDEARAGGADRRDEPA